MVEILIVIVLVGILAIVALPQMLDFRSEAKIAAARNFITTVNSSIVGKKAQTALKCGRPYTDAPNLNALYLNDVTEGGAPGAYCTAVQIPNLDDRKFTDAPMADAPENPYNGRIDIVLTSCTDFCACADVGVISTIRLRENLALRIVQDGETVRQVALRQVALQQVALRQVLLAAPLITLAVTPFATILARQLFWIPFALAAVVQRVQRLRHRVLSMKYQEAVAMQGRDLG